MLDVDRNTVLLSILTLILTLALVLLVLSRYSDLKRNYWIVNVTVIIAFTFPFAAFVLLPLDIISTSYTSCLKRENREQCERPLLFVEEDTLFVLWRIVYWTAFSLTWFIIPIMETYLDQGGFNFRKKFRWAVIRQLLYFAIAGIVGIIAIVYLVVKENKGSWQATKFYLIAASNSWGLILIISFMGYGLVDVPRKFFLWSQPRRLLLSMELDAPKYRERLVDNDRDVRDALDLLRAASESLEAMHPKKEIIEKMLNTPGYDPSEGSYNPSRLTSNLPNPLTDAYLEDVHLKLKRAIQSRDRNRELWVQLLAEAFRVQDIIANTDSPDRKLTSALVVLSGSKLDDFKISAKWWAYVIFQPLFLKLLSLLALMMTIVVVWSELTFSFTNPPLSIVAILFQKLEGHYTILQPISGFFIIYMSYCAYSTLFQVKIFNYYVLVPNRHTDQISLLFCGAYLCRLAMPLYYNFLLLAGIDKNTDCVFSQLMGTMDLVPFLGDKFNYWFPFLILIPMFMALTDGHRKIAAYFSVDDFFLDAESPQGRLREGRELLKAERVRAERLVQSSISRSSPDRNGGTSTNNGRSGYRPSRSMAVEISNGGSSRFLDDSDDEEAGNSASRANTYQDSEGQLSTSQRVKRFFRNWRFPSYGSRPGTPQNYQDVYPDEDDLDEYDELYEQNSFA